MEEYLFAKITDDGLLDLRRATSREGKKVTELTESGFRHFVPAQMPTVQPGEKLVDTFSEVDGKIIQEWHIIPDESAINARIDELKQQLEDTDYMVTKCYESFMVGEELPYNITELHEKRDAIRLEINELQNKLA